MIPTPSLRETPPEISVFQSTIQENGTGLTEVNLMVNSKLCCENCLSTAEILSNASLALSGQIRIGEFPHRGLAR